MARERFADTLTSLSQSVMTNLDAQVAEMDRLSLTLIYSQVFQGLYARHLALPRAPRSAEQRIAKLENTEALIEICETILGPNRSAPQVNVFDLRGEMIGAGYYSRLIERDVTREPWYPDVKRGGGERVIACPAHGSAPGSRPRSSSRTSATCPCCGRSRTPSCPREGIVEVEQYCDALFSELDLLTRLVRVDLRLRRRRNQLYPYEGCSRRPRDAPARSPPRR